MDICTNDDGAELSASAERPDPDWPQPHPEKPNAQALSDDAAREATRCYVERVDRYLARPDVLKVGRNAAPSFSSGS